MYVVVEVGLTVKSNAGPKPLRVPPPLSSVRLYGAVPPETVTVTVE